MKEIMSVHACIVDYCSDSPISILSCVPSQLACYIYGDRSCVTNSAIASFLRMTACLVKVTLYCFDLIIAAAAWAAACLAGRALMMTCIYN
jgi:hypothetical protein